MKTNFYDNLTRQSLAGKLTKSSCLEILENPELETIDLLAAAYKIRRQFFGKEVFIHILNNVQNGCCSQDCNYCAQSSKSGVAVAQYPMKNVDEIYTEAEAAFKKGAFRYCLVLSGPRLLPAQSDILIEAIKQIKASLDLEVCVSPGFIDEGQAKALVGAGLDRYNHNLNTSRRYYPEICSTHSYDDRWQSLKVAAQAGLKICSGVIVGMGETNQDLVEVGLTLKELKADSIPVNFYIPLAAKISVPNDLTPSFCLRVLCLFRFLNPKTDLRIAAGREIYLRDLQPLALYAASSLFLYGYLNVKGKEAALGLRMIKDAGFTIRTEENIESFVPVAEAQESVDLKSFSDLRPGLR